MKRLAYEGAILVPMAVTWSCRYCSPLKEKLLKVSICSINLLRYDVGGAPSGLRVSRAFLHASIPSAWGMLV